MATGAEIVLLDITGVPLVDTAVAKHLLEMVSAARLLGCEVFVVGLSARIAMTLAKGLELAFDRLGLAVVPRPGGGRTAGIDEGAF